MPLRPLQSAFALLLSSALPVCAQIDPYPRHLLQLGYDYALSSKGPQSLYAYYYYNNPAFLLYQYNFVQRKARSSAFR